MVPLENGPVKIDFGAMANKCSLVFRTVRRYLRHPAISSA